MKTKSISFTKNNLSIGLVLLVLSVVLFTNNTLFGIIILPIIGVLFPHTILAQLILLPIIEMALIAVPGITISTYLYLFYILYFASVIIFNNFKFSFGGIKFFILFCFVIFYGLLNVLFNQSVVSHAGGISIIFNRVLLMYLPRLVLFYLFTVFLHNKGLNYVLQSISVLKAIVPFFIILVLLYLFSGHIKVVVWRGLVERGTFQNTNANDFSLMLTALIPFLLISIYYNKLFLTRIINLAAFLIVIFLVMLSGSRGSLVALILGIFMIIFLNDWYKKISKNTIYIIFGFAIVIIAVFFTNIYNVQSVIYRFTYHDTMSGLSANRSDFWLNALEYIPKRPIIGYGATEFTTKYYNKIGIGYDNVMHSSFFQVLF